MVGPSVADARAEIAEGRPSSARRAACRGRRLECAAEEADRDRAVLHSEDRDDVETPRARARAGRAAGNHSAARKDPTLLLDGDRLLGKSEPRAPASLHLDEAEDAALHRDEIDLPGPRPGNYAPGSGSPRAGGAGPRGPPQAGPTAKPARAPHAGAGEIREETQRPGRERSERRRIASSLSRGAEPGADTRPSARRRDRTLRRPRDHGLKSQPARHATGAVVEPETGAWLQRRTLPPRSLWYSYVASRTRRTIR